MYKKLFLALCLALTIIGATTACGTAKSSATTPDKAAASSAPASAKAEAAKSSKDLAPDITVTKLDGTQVKLSDLRGKPVFLNFWATWCPPCVGEMPHFQTLYPKYGNDIQFLAVSVDNTQEAAKNFIGEKGYSFPVAWDKDKSASRTYKVSAIPTSILIDAEGKIIKKNLGSMNASALEDFLKSALAK